MSNYSDNNPRDNVLCQITGFVCIIGLYIACAIFGLIKWIFSSPLIFIGVVLAVYFICFYKPAGEYKPPEILEEKDENEERTIEVREED